MPSFDIVSEMDRHEVTNAVNQANREVGNRFDFKGTDTKYDLKDDKITLKAEVDFQLNQMIDILRQKLTKRGVDVGHLKIGEPTIQHKKAEQVITLQEGIAQDVAKKIVKFIKDHKAKVQPTIQGDQVRVTGKKLDDLQKMISLIEGHDFGLPLQCGNYRD